MRYTIAEPTTEPLTLSEVKNWLRVDHTADDSLIESLTKAARRWVFNETGRCFTPQAVTEYLDEFPDCCTIELSVPQVSTVTKVEVFLDDATAFSDWASSNYTADTVSVPARIVKKGNATYPTLECLPNAVKITYTAGTATCPEDVKAAMFLWIAFHYENREDIPVNETRNPRIRSAKAILDNYRTWRI